jgi:DNA-binding XRE family transcriptional regulator
MNTVTSLNSTSPTRSPAAQQPSSSSGIVAGTVLRAARLSTSLSQSQLAVAVDADEAAVAAWEDGTEPLATLPYAVVERLEATLAAARADSALVRDLTAATWCDLVIEAIANSEDIQCLMSDPIATEQAFAELVSWSIGGDRPDRYSPYVGPGPLINDCAITASAIRRLAAPRPMVTTRAA